MRSRFYCLHQLAYVLFLLSNFNNIFLLFFFFFFFFFVLPFLWQVIYSPTGFCIHQMFYESLVFHERADLSRNSNKQMSGTSFKIQVSVKPIRRKKVNICKNRSKCSLFWAQSVLFLGRGGPRVAHFAILLQLRRLFCHLNRMQKQRNPITQIL